MANKRAGSAAKRRGRKPASSYSRHVISLLSQRDEQMTQIDLIASADAALYQAKREGKNHVTVSGAW